MVIKIKNKHSLKKKEIRELISEIRNIFSIDLSVDNFKVDTGFFNDVKIIFFDDVPCFMIIDDILYFTLHGVLKFKPKDKFVVVDMGAVGYIINGADLMAPGIVDADYNIERGDHVWICDEQHHKPLATGIAIMNGDEMIKGNKGKSVKIIHFVGDKYWNINK
jgi:PUA domain protein